MWILLESCLSECPSRPAGVYLGFLGEGVLLSTASEVSNRVKTGSGAGGLLEWHRPPSGIQVYEDHLSHLGRQKGTWAR